MDPFRLTLVLVGYFVLEKANDYVLATVCDQFDTSSQQFVESPWTHLYVWDVVHYVDIAKQYAQGAHMPEFEHQYAFNSLWPRIIGLLPGKTTLEILQKFIFGSLLCNALAVYLIYYMTSLTNKNIAMATALVYIANPAGIFLIGGYPESAFAAVSFLGLILFIKKRYILSGLAFGVSCGLRGNGLLWGLLFLNAVLDFRSLLPKIIGGSLIGLGFLAPQVEAYLRLCPGRPWCNSLFPSVYSYVQGHYWNVGMFQYWSLAELPNFLLAFPTLLLLYRSLGANPNRGLKVVQLAMIIGSLFFWNVQIITRLQSCLPGPVWYVASLLRNGEVEGKLWLGYFLLWTRVQATLYGAFLPPA